MNDHEVSTEITALDRDPWVRLDDGSVLVNWGRREEEIYNQMNRQRAKYQFYRHAFDMLSASGNGIVGDYHEYGCHRCRTFRMALTEARRHLMDFMQFYAFDSFQGLPASATATGVRTWTEGGLATTEGDFLACVRNHGIYVDQVRLVKGFYQDSLTARLQREFVDAHREIALVTVDCDLYESAVPVFDFIEPLLQEGSIVYVDDFFAGYKGSPARGVSRAFREFQRKSRWKFAAHLNVGWWGRSFVTYAGTNPPVG
jgi:O-methyltransferase